MHLVRTLILFAVHERNRESWFSCVCECWFESWFQIGAGFGVFCQKGEFFVGRFLSQSIPHKSKLAFSHISHNFSYNRDTTMKSIIASIILAISLASTPAAPQTIVTIKPHQIKGLRGSGHVPPDGAVPAKKGSVFLVGFRFDDIKPSSIEAQFFHDEETHVFVRRNDKIGNEDEKEYYWYGEDTLMHENTMNLVFSEGVDGTNVMG